MIDDGTLATAVLAVHVAIIGFNVFGLIAVPLGAWRGWRFARGFWWRAVHLSTMAVVAVQAAVGRACFLTIWQDDLAGEGGSAASGHVPLIVRWVNGVVFWPLPLWVFAVAYALLLGYVLALWWWVRPVAPAIVRRFRDGRGLSARVSIPSATASSSAPRPGPCPADSGEREKSRQRPGAAAPRSG